MGTQGTPLPSTASVMIYDANDLNEPRFDTLEQAIDAIRQPTMGWLHLQSLDDELAAVLEERLGLHHLALEDSRNERQLAKTEVFDDHHYVVTRALTFDDRGRVTVPQLNLFVGVGWVVSIGERPAGLYDGVRARIRSGRVRIRSHGSDYLAYALVDAVVDTYAPILDLTAERLETLEDVLLHELEPSVLPTDGGVGDLEEPALDGQVPVDTQGFEPTNASSGLAVLHGLRRDLRRVRRSVAPAREALATLQRLADDPNKPRVDEVRGKVSGPPPRVFLRDVADHVNQAVERIESQREMAASLIDLHLTLVSHRTNEVMRVLTIVATIFIPLGFLAGVYGMNFDTTVSPYNLPELSWRFGYPAFWTMIALIVGTMFIVFRRKGWV